MISNNENAIVLRTEFSDNQKWDKLCDIIKTPINDFVAYVDFISEIKYKDLSIKQLLSLIPEDFDQTFIFIVDKETFSKKEQSILCVDLFDEPGRSFRVIPSEMWSVENNLSLVNMDFEEFYESTDENGIFKGF
jgi:hypothetical protein